MPIALEHQLKARARRLARSGMLHTKSGETSEEAQNAYTYSTLREIEKKHRQKGGKAGKYYHGKISQ